MSPAYTSHVKLLSKWGTRGSKDGEFSWPLGLAIGSNHNIYVSECSNDRVQVFDTQGRFLRKWGRTGNGNGEFIRPQDVATDDCADIYVSDRDLSLIHI